MENKTMCRRQNNWNKNVNSALFTYLLHLFTYLLHLFTYLLHFLLIYYIFLCLFRTTLLNYRHGRNNGWSRDTTSRHVRISPTWLESTNQEPPSTPPRWEHDLQPHPEGSRYDHHQSDENRTLIPSPTVRGPPCAPAGYQTPTTAPCRRGRGSTHPVQ